ncbi:PREDICTED: uncharacterized protein LOC109583451 [Amphimedon queenslandica]|uniref:Uncharacterized protein n=1 Tax=Amphimedon queenslandica TaxID=400682 RepID=A0A1X7UGD9_AMPQE|nr:PREDICTED: uncharacterized protein LOC109583451 [Amphimedon queenslandica]|eukprot:XP_019854366.1 PREDICTED: uncharacterized protein LOC109583451 [Amphimedon queenslandica]
MKTMKNLLMKNDNEELGDEEPGDVYIVIKGGITTITGGTTTFTADSATVMGGEVMPQNNPNQNEEYEGTSLEKDPRLIKKEIIKVAVANWFCIGLFLIADNSQPFDCVVEENINFNYALRIIFLFISLILYCLSILKVTQLWYQSRDPTPVDRDPTSVDRDPSPIDHDPTIDRDPTPIDHEPSPVDHDPTPIDRDTTTGGTAHTHTLPRDQTSPESRCTSVVV